jgi:hypothetical protein
MGLAKFWTNARGLWTSELWSYPEFSGRRRSRYEAKVFRDRTAQPGTRQNGRESGQDSGGSGLKGFSPNLPPQSPNSLHDPPWPKCAPRPQVLAHSLVRPWEVSGSPPQGRRPGVLAKNSFWPKQTAMARHAPLVGGGAPDQNALQAKQRTLSTCRRGVWRVWSSSLEVGRDARGILFWPRQTEMLAQPPFCQGCLKRAMATRENWENSARPFLLLLPFPKSAVVPPCFCVSALGLC